jgi:hypothetical protein
MNGCRVIGTVGAAFREVRPYQLLLRPHTWPARLPYAEYRPSDVNVSTADVRNGQLGAEQLQEISANGFTAGPLSTCPSGANWDP